MAKKHIRNEVFKLGFDLFKPIIPERKWNNSFKALLNATNTHEPTRNMMNEIYSNFIDNDGNFVEQFQSTGFDARTFELYLFAYFSKSGFVFEESFNRPDFIVKKNGIRIAIEATTTNPTEGVIESEQDTLYTNEELSLKLNHELPIKFGSSLYSKLNKNYWQLDHCKEIPLVLAIEAFHDIDSLSYSSSSLIQYLFGEEDQLVVDKSGNAVIETRKIDSHIVGNKKIPSGFFKQPNAENISAVLFSNSGTTAKFKRMGFQDGMHSKFLKVLRRGLEFDYEPSSTSPKVFSYDLDDFNEETWGEGLVICLNPNAKFPLPKDIFPNAAQYHEFNGKTVADIFGFHPYSSTTTTVGSDYKCEPLPKEIRTLFKSELDQLLGNLQPPPFTREYEWYISIDESVIGLILFCEQDLNWSYVCLGNNGAGYEATSVKIDFLELDDVRAKLLEAMTAYLK